MKYDLNSAVCTTIGRKRGMNQDNFYLNGQILKDTGCQKLMLNNSSKRGVFSVCDGMGGEADGDVASRIVVEELKHASSVGTADDELIVQAVDNANLRICDHIKKVGRTCGSTFAAVSIDGKKASVYNIGDSRCYLIRNGSIRQLSKDHTLTRQMVASGMMTEEQAKTDPRRHQLTQHLGIFPEEMILSLYRDNAEIMEGDMFLLCSDGLTDGLDDNTIMKITYKKDSLDQRVNDLVEEAMNAGSTDNVTAMLIEIVRDNQSGLAGALYAMICVCSGLLGALLAIIILFLGG